MIRIITGDATQPKSKGPVIIAHGCNNQGKWGKGFVLALSEVYPEAEEEYRKWSKDDSWVDETMIPGAVQFVYPPNTGVCIANMITQVGTRSEVIDGKIVVPVRYDAIQNCLEKVRIRALQDGASVHMPKIGSGLAGGDWNVIFRIIEKILHDIDTTIYVYKQE